MTRTLGDALSVDLLAKDRTIMGYKTRLKIGEFSRLMQVTVKTLRHYEQKHNQQTFEHSNQEYIASTAHMWQLFFKISHFLVVNP